MGERSEDLNEKTIHLLARAREGDSEAMNVLYKLYEIRLKGAVKGQLGDKLRAKMETVDLVQSVWTDVLSDMDGFDYQGPDSFFQWLKFRTLRKIQDKGRYFARGKRNPKEEGKGELRESSSPPAPDPTPTQAAMVEEDLNRLMYLLNHLPNLQRQALVLRMRDRMEFDDIAKVMDRTPGAVRQLYLRALKRLHELVRGKEDRDDDECRD